MLSWIWGERKEGSQHYNFVEENNENLNLESILCYFDFITAEHLEDIYSNNSIIFWVPRITDIESMGWWEALIFKAKNQQL